VVAYPSSAVGCFDAFNIHRVMSLYTVAGNVI
jgi:hypothetical protein